MRKICVCSVFVGIMLLFPTVLSSAPEKTTPQEQNNASNISILPAKVFVWCKWRQHQDRGAGERTIHFLVIGFGHHVLEWQTWDDPNGDGEWDWWGPYPPNEREWFMFFPLRHCTDFSSWSGYIPAEGCKPRVKVVYWIDGIKHTAIFEPKEW